ncbi:hypothetical protein ACLBWS_12215 [Brucellaceae bacterium D45D]
MQLWPWKEICEMPDYRYWQTRRRKRNPYCQDWGAQLTKSWRQGDGGEEEERHVFEISAMKSRHPVERRWLEK